MKFGVREICDVTFKTTADNQRVGKTLFAKAGMPAFMIDTAKTSSLEQATTTVYAQGGKGNNRLIAWEGEKTMTFTVEDALISPMGLAVLSGAGLLDASDKRLAHVHITLDKTVGANGEVKVSLDELKEETGLEEDKFFVCATIPTYATVLDGSGAGIRFVDSVDVAEDDNKEIATVEAGKEAVFTCKITGEDNVAKAVDAGTVVKLDFYLLMNSGITEVEIKPQDFGGYFYVEAQTLYRREDTGKDMAAEIILPKVKVQSGFTFTMASSGDPSTFTFTMDAFPGYTMFDKTKKVMCVMQIIGNDAEGVDAEANHVHTEDILGN